MLPIQSLAALDLACSNGRIQWGDSLTWSVEAGMTLLCMLIAHSFSGLDGEWRLVSWSSSTMAFSWHLRKWEKTCSSCSSSSLSSSFSCQTCLTHAWFYQPYRFAQFYQAVLNLAVKLKSRLIFALHSVCTSSQVNTEALVVSNIFASVFYMHHNQPWTQFRSVIYRFVLLQLLVQTCLHGGFPWIGLSSFNAIPILFLNSNVFDVIN